MRRTALAVALLLATAPVARAEGPATDVKPDLRVVETTAPAVRQEAVKPIRVETEAPAKKTAATVQSLDRNFIYLVAAIAAGIVIAVLLLD